VSSLTFDPLRTEFLYFSVNKTYKISDDVKREFVIKKNRILEQEYLSA